MTDVVELEAGGIAGWLASARRDPRAVHVHRVEPRPAAWGELESPLPDVIAHLRPEGGFYAHQVEAIDRLRSGRSVAIATRTASGKSLCFQVPLAEAITAEPGGTALLLYPTKALAQDQLRALEELDVPGLRAATYDGDSSAEERAWVRDNANVVLTNPEMLHHALLPNHRRWAPFLAMLDLIVVDEVHTMRGVFGSHVGHVLRRLERVAHHHGADPRYAFCSATVGDPGRLASDLCGRPVDVVSTDASPAGERTVVLWNPAAAPRRPGSRPRTLARETVRVAASLVESGLSPVVFCRSRRATEVVASMLRRRLDHLDPWRIRSYRSGYLPEERREIEAAVADGEVDVVVATSALELGVDIAGLDAVVLSGFPGTVASMWQQIGRCGRRGAASLAVVVAGDDPLDQWVVANPHEAMTRPPEPVVVNPSNPLVLDAHLACAAQERPIVHGDEWLWGDDVHDGVRRGVLADRLTVRQRRDEPVAVFSGKGWPAAGISLRSSSAGELDIVDDGGTRIGTIDSARAVEQTHPGAVYLHQGRAFLVVDLDLEGRTVSVEPCDGSTYTQPVAATSLRILERRGERHVGGLVVEHGIVEVTRQVTGYRERRVDDHALLGTGDLDLPPSTMSTTGTWICFPDDVLAADAASVVPSLHAVEHAAIGILPLFALCDRSDVSGATAERSDDTGLPTVFLHDTHPGGAGVAPMAFEAADAHLAATLDVIERCGCTDGCPSCVHSPRCGTGNEPLDKLGAAALLRSVLRTSASAA